MGFLNEKDFQICSDTSAFKKVLNSKLEPKKYASILEGVHYETELLKLQAELVDLQQWVAKHKKRVCVVFEGRDAAGKGGAIRRFTEHLNPRSMRVVALTKPTCVTIVHKVHNSTRPSINPIWHRIWKGFGNKHKKGKNQET